MEGPLPRWQRAMAWIAPQAPEHDAGSPPTSASTSSTLAVTNYHSYLSQDWSNALVWTPRGVPEQDEKTRRDSSKQAETPMTGDMSQYQTPTSTTTLPFSPATEDTSYRQPLFPPRTQRPVSVDLDAKDRAHPRNWPMRRRALINTALNLWTFAVVFASTAYVSSVPDLEVEFGISQTGARAVAGPYKNAHGASASSCSARSLAVRWRLWRRTFALRPTQRALWAAPHLHRERRAVRGNVVVCERVEQRVNAAVLSLSSRLHGLHRYVVVRAGWRRSALIVLAT